MPDHTGRIWRRAAQLLGRLKHRIAGRDVASTTGPAVAFMHIPKTSGVAVISALSAHHRDGCVLRGFDHSLFGAFDAFDTIEEDVKRHIYESPAALPRDCTLVAGHFGYSTIRNAYPNAALMTVLREPVSRLLSHWMYWRGRSAEELKPFGEWAEIVRLSHGSLGDFLDEPRIAPQTDNVALRMLLWPHPLLKVNQFIAPEDDRMLLRMAFRRLRRFSFIDIVENQSFSANLARWLDVKLSYDRSNETDTIPVNLRCPLQKELSAATCQSLAARSRLDLVLWKWVANRRLPKADYRALRDRALLGNVARYSALMGKSP